MTKIVWRCWAGLLALSMLFLLVALGATVFSPSQAQAAPAPAPVADVTPTRWVFGVDSPALDAGIQYWNQLFGRSVLKYGGGFDLAPVDASAVTEQVVPVAVGLAGLTQGNVGVGPLLVSIDPASASDWVIWAHELGHTLGLGHHDEAGYRGVMRSVPLGYKVRPADDKRFVV